MSDQASVLTGLEAQMPHAKGAARRRPLTGRRYALEMRQAMGWGWQAVVLMRRLPRRRRHAAILGLLPWSWAAFLATAACAAGIAVMAEVGIAWVTVEAFR